MRNLTRRDFIRLSVLTLGGIALAGCRREEIPGVTARPLTAPPPTAAVPTARTTVTAPAAPTLAMPPTLAPATFPPGTLADTILVNGKVVTMDAADTIVQAVAVKDDRILQTGTTDKIRALAGPKTQTIDLRGRVLTPGLIDPHNHFRAMGLLNKAYVPFLLPEIKSIQDMQAKLADIAAKTPQGQWITGYYLSVGKDEIPDKQDLDKAAPAHPVWMMQQAGHYAVTNRMGLKIAGITASTPSPQGGIIEKDAKGEPTGRLFNHRAMNVVRAFIPAYDPQVVRDSIVETQTPFAACGTTSFQDNNVYESDFITTYADLAQQGKMYLRGSVYYTLEYPADVQTALKFKPFNDPYMKFAGYKFLIDGQATTAYCHEPHSGVSWNMPTWEPRSYKQAIRAMHDTGLQICVHCGGDAAVDLTLDAFEEAIKANPRPDPRHRLEHAVITTPQATQRIKDLGVIVSTNPIFLRLSGDYYYTLFGEKRVEERVMVTREWLDAGVHLTIGSDAPCCPWYTPQQTMAAAVARLTLTNKVLGRDQVMTFKEALRAHTIAAAFAGFEEKIKGSLESGKLADLTIWTLDPFAMSVQQLFQATMDLTMVGGKIVYQKA